MTWQVRKCNNFKSDERYIEKYSVEYFGYFYPSPILASKARRPYLELEKFLIL
jgi:hypothetical protein